MAKKKGKSKQQSPLSSSLSSPSIPAAKAKGCNPTPPTPANTPVSQSKPRGNTGQCDTCPPQVNISLWKRFYEPLVLLSAYGKSQGKHVKSDELSSEGYFDGSGKTLRQKFLDGLAYICDYTASGKTVAAIAIQGGPQLVYWVAANTNQGPRVKPFLSNILRLLGQVYDASEERVSALTRQVSSCSIVFSTKKLQRYKLQLRNAIKTCIPVLQRQNTEGPRRFHTPEFPSVSLIL